MAEVTVNIKADITDVEKDVIKLTRELRDAKTALKDLDKTTEEYAKQKQNVDQLSAALTKQKDALTDLKLEAKRTSTGFTEAKERMGDLKDEAITLEGSGIERLKNSFGLLKDGLENADYEKVKTGFKGIGNAMKAVPIFLLVQLFDKLINEFDETVEKFKEFFDLQSDGEKAVKSLNEELEKQKEINKAATAGLENEIKILEAQGASNDKIIAKKKELNALKIRELEIDTELQKKKIEEILLNDSLEESVTRYNIALQRKLGNDKVADTLEKALLNDKIKRAKAETDKIRENAISVANLKTEIIVEETKRDTEAAKKAKENRDKLRKDTLKSFDDAISDQDLQNEKIIGGINKQNEAQIAANKAYDEAVKNNAIKSYEERLAWEKYLEDRAEKERQARIQARWQIEQNAISAAMSLADTYWQEQIENSASDEARNLEIRKKAFAVNKAFQLGQATIDGYRAVLSAYAGAPPGFKVASAVAAGLVAAANIAKIAAVQFTGDKASGGAPKGTISTGGSGGGGNTTPNQPTLPSNQTQPTTQFDDQGNRINQQPIIVKVSEINDTQKRVARVKEQATF